MDERLDLCTGAKIETDYTLAAETYANLEAKGKFRIETPQTDAAEAASIVKWLNPT